MGIKFNDILNRVRNRAKYFFDLGRDSIVVLFCNLAFKLYRIAVLQHGIQALVSQFGLEIRRRVDIFSYRHLSPDSIDILYDKTHSMHYTYPVFKDGADGNGKLYSATGRFYGARINSPCIIGGSNLLLVGLDAVLYETAEQHQNPNCQFIDGALLHYNRELYMIHSKGSPNIIDRGICLSGNFSWNYFHFLFEFIARFKAIEEIQTDLDIPLLIDEKLKQVPQYMDLLNIFNEKHLKYVTLEFGVKYEVKELIHVSSPNHIPPHFKRLAGISPGDCLYNFESLNYLRTNLLKVASDKKFPKRIFISRSKASDRRRFNEDEVFMVLEKAGFVKIAPESLSLSDQIAMFNQADLIAGGTGAAFSNLLFCRDSCKVLCFTNYMLPLSIFSTIAFFSGSDLKYIHDKKRKRHSKSRLHDPFRINTTELEKFLHEWAN
jgi:capsular polysaccharide biosynthesis protein